MQVTKRSGQVVDFNPDKIYQAIIKAAQTVYVIDDTWRDNLANVTKKVVIDLQDAQVERPTISMVQSCVENRLMDAGYINIAEHYISYRLQRDLERNGYADKIIVHLRFEQTK
ncbi:ATP cone domain-containing protein [Streptococcus loxodontisalivarius]|uniref:Anaerobic ribonucleoside-triphosphate reductase n=1 Tax=Streptococcus loxodontisalivarius TaxID=1349415 RepID=A0ABS2PPN9_9STRE|nr:ATP cone domain-containing protein [Streptococcus loxodontisalivarius]MBM7641994.1 anaerobic ribonucleoside-triphosphate reductase [Streptococcus loxodontisalivarius]